MAPGIVTDLIVIGIVVLSGLFALARGLVKELLSIASWGGAVLVTLFGFLPARAIARDVIDWPLAADVAAGTALFLGSLFIFSFISHFIAKAVHGSAVGALNRTLGFVFGLARGLLIVVVLYLAAGWAIGQNDQPAWFRNARTVPLAAAGATLVLRLVPEDMRKMFPPAVQPESRNRPAPAAAPKEREGYRPSERRDMQRLIEGSQ
ncbi:MAG: CvpA family protein [Alphaproteobacteria bacterium]